MPHAVSLPSRLPLGRPLFVRGAISVLSRPGVAIVGARRPNLGGAAVTCAFATQVANSGFVVVSGLALGCDTAAHRGCLSAGGSTVGVLPCGVDRVAPASNSQLAERILKSDGCLASEYPAGTPPRNFRFVERNRVIAALSQAVIIVEANIKSGTMHTARFALKQNKPLACYVPDIGKASPGCLHLVQNHGARILRNANDLKYFSEVFLSYRKRTGSSKQMFWGEGVNGHECPGGGRFIHELNKPENSNGER